MALKKFHFEVISKEGKTLSGFLFSESVEAARSKLQSEGNAVLSLDLYKAEEKENSDLQEFEFKALASNGRVVKGEIEAETQYVAYRKLRLEYDFQLDYLVLKNLPFEQKESLKKQSINPELALLFEKDEEIKKKKKKEKKVKKGRVEQMLEDRKDEMRFLQAETEVIVQTVKQLLIDHAQHLNSAKKRDIQDNLDRLSRLRHSSSINHLEQIMKRIFKKLRSDNLFIFTEENILEVEQSQKEIKRVVRKLELELKKGLSKVQVGDLEKLTKVFQAGVVSKVLVTVYWGFVFLLVMLLSFWVLHGVKFFFGKDIEKINFYFSSNSLWFLTGMSAIVVGFFAFDVFARTKPLTLAKRIILYGIGFGVLAVFTLQFPALFFWTR
jgi:hypothetical protein